MKGVHPWLVRWARRAGKTIVCSALAALVSPVQNTIFLTSHLFTLFSPHRPTTCAGSRAGSPVSVYLPMPQLHTSVALPAHILMSTSVS
jgi:hypothetical protein